MSKALQLACPQCHGLLSRSSSVELVTRWVYWARCEPCSTRFKVVMTTEIKVLTCDDNNNKVGPCQEPAPARNAIKAGKRARKTATPSSAPDVNGLTGRKRNGNDTP